MLLLSAQSECSALAGLLEVESHEVQRCDVAKLACPACQDLAGTLRDAVVLDLGQLLAENQALLQAPCLLELEVAADAHEDQELVGHDQQALGHLADLSMAIDVRKQGVEQQLLVHEEAIVRMKEQLVHKCEILVVDSDLASEVDSARRTNSDLLDVQALQLGLAAVSDDVGRA